MDEKERQALELEDIIKEFGGTPIEEPEEEVQQAPEEEEVLEDFDEESFRQWLDQETPAQAPEDTEEAPVAEEDDDVALADWLNNREAETQPEDLQETRRIDLEDLQETRRRDAADLQTTRRINTEDLQATRRMEPVSTQPAAQTVTGDTIRLDGLGGDFAERVKREEPAEDTREDRIWTPGDTIHREPFSKYWEPEYEQPIGEYVPPQPIQFQPRSRLRELKKKLIAGPEKRYYELMETGVGKLQVLMFLSILVVLICAISTGMYALGLVQENRMRLMVFGQFLAMLISALLGSNQLIEGVADIGKKRFTLNTLLTVTFLVCCVDGALCLHQIRVPCCAAFSLEVTMSLWREYQRKSIEMLQMDTMRKATRLDGVAAYEDYLDGKKGLLRKEGQVEDFMDHYAQLSKPEKKLNLYCFIAMCIACAIGIFAGVMEGLSAGIQVAAVSLLAAVPATAFIAHSRPAILLERRLHKLGTVLCGWQGVEGLCGKTVFPVTFQDLYSADTVRLNGVKFFGSREPELVVAYATAVVTADGSGLTGLFTQVLDSHNGRHYDAFNLIHYENGGVCGVVEGETVLLGSASFLKEMGIEVPENARISYAVYVAIDNELSGLFAVSYEKTKSTTAGLTTLNAYRGLQCALISDDFMLTHGFLRSKFGIKPKRFLLPDYETRQELRKKELEEQQALLLTTALGLAPVAYAVTGARALRTTSRMGTVLHIVGGSIGLAIMVLLVVLGALELLTPANMFLYQLVWMIPAILFTEWTRSI